MTEEQKKAADQFFISKLAQAPQNVEYAPESEAFKRFLRDELYDPCDDRGGFMGQSHFRQYVDTHWFQPVLNNYGFHL